MRVVLDTNVVVAALRSRRGASFRVLSLVGTGRFETTVSVPLVLEYEEVLTRQSATLGITSEDVAAVLDYLCSASVHQTVFFLWRPRLPDPEDDMMLEAAVAGGCDAIITHNTRDFAGADSFSIRVLTPREFLEELT